MTYYESYKRCKTIDEIEKEVKSDIATAILINPDRIESIRKAAEIAMNELEESMEK